MPPTETTGFMAIQRMDVFRAVLEQIERYISSNHLQPGDRLPSDRELASRLGVSRPIVRQALKVLEGLGRISVQQGVGTFVREDSLSVAIRQLLSGIDTEGPDFLAQLLPVRTAVEREVLTAAFAHRTPENLDQVRASLAEQEGVADDPVDVRLHLEFEAAMGRICGNEILRRFQALTHEMWLQAQIALEATAADMETFHRHHVQIFEAFEKGDLPGCLDLVESHLALLKR